MGVSVKMSEFTGTVSTHLGGGFGDEVHNVDKDFRRDVLGYNTNDTTFEVWAFTPIKDLYERRFSEAVEKYNQSQIEKHHSERQIEDYYEKVLEIERKGDERKAETGKKNYQHTQYELIVGIGNVENMPDVNESKEVYKEFAEWFQSSFPQFDINFISWQADEDGAPEIQIGFVPWATGYKRGPAVQNSISNSLKQMGYSSGEGKDFTDDCRFKLQELCEARGWNIIHPQAGTNTKHVPTNIYKKQKEVDRKMTEVEDERAKLIVEKSEFETEKTEFKEKVVKHYQKEFNEKLKQERADLARERSEFRERVRKEVKSEMSVERENLSSERVSLSEDKKALEDAKRTIQEQQRALDALVAGSIENYAKIKRPEWIREYNEYRANYQKTVKGAVVDGRSVLSNGDKDLTI